MKEDVIADGSVIVTLSGSKQLFESETVNICVPADKALGFAVPQSSESVPVPPLKVRVAVPSFPPLQLTFVVDEETVIALGSVISIVSVSKQLFESETVNICVPADKALGFATPQLGGQCSCFLHLK